MSETSAVGAAPLGTRAQGGVREIMAEDVAEAGSSFRHGPRAALAEPDSVTLALASQNYPVAFAFYLECVAGHGIPSQAATHRKPPPFPLPDQSRRTQLRNPARPPDRPSRPPVAKD